MIAFKEQSRDAATCDFEQGVRSRPEIALMQHNLADASILTNQVRQMKLIEEALQLRLDRMISDSFVSRGCRQ